MQIKIDTVDISRLGNLIAAAGKQAPHAIRRALNHTGDKTRTQVVRALRDQTGAKYGAIRKALHITRANYGSLAYVIDAKDKHLELKDFGARETRKGVSAAPWGQRRIFPGTFMKGGRFPNRVAAGRLNGQVFKRTGKGRLPIEKLWGPAIPKEMVKGESEKAFFSTVQSTLPDRIRHELYRVLPS